MTIKVTSPFSDETITKLKAGDNLLISGIIYVGRDSAHKKIVEALDKGDKLPFDIMGQTIYYMGPSPAKPGQVIGSAGPTTSGRMDAYSPRLIKEGLRVMIGKGSRTAEVKEAIKKYRGLYLAAIGGAGALISRTIKKSEIVAYPELGAEAILKLDVEDFPAAVINDIHGGDLYEEGKTKFQKK